MANRVTTSPSRYRALIWEHLDQDEPLRYRWLHEHPHQHHIIEHLVNDCLHFARTANLDLHDTAGKRALHQLIVEPDDIDEMDITITGLVLGADTLWEDVHHQWPREPPTTLDAPYLNNDEDEDDEDDDDEVLEEWMVDLFVDYLDDVRTNPNTNQQRPE